MREDVDPEVTLGWGRQLCHMREFLSLSQEQFAATMTHLGKQPECDADFAKLHLSHVTKISALDICRFERGIRTPVHRRTHLFLVWALVRLGALKTPEQTNAWLDSGYQGWLTAREHGMLFGSHECQSSRQADCDRSMHRDL